MTPEERVELYILSKKYVEEYEKDEKHENTIDFFWRRNRELKYILHLDEAKREVELGEFYKHGIIKHSNQRGKVTASDISAAMVAAERVRA
jgi:hypothetical protein